MKPSTIVTATGADHADRIIRAMIDQAIGVYSARKCHVDELARTLFKRGQLLVAKRLESEATASWSRAYGIRRSIVKDDLRPAKEVMEKDYDRLIIFWNR